jgi:hypothetical protein
LGVESEALPTPGGPLAPSVLTHHVDNARTGANLRERILTTSNVSPTTFGKLYEIDVDGVVYAQPLYVPRSVVHPDTHKKVDAIIVATETNHVIAYDAQAAAPRILWQTQVGPAADPIVLRPPGTGPANSIGTNIGITSTPVVDLAQRLVFVVSMEQRSRNTPNGPVPTFEYRLHGLDLATGNIEKSASVQPELSDGIAFDARYFVQRTALTLTHTRKIVFGFGSLWADHGPYRGVVVSYDADDLSRQGTVDSLAGSPGVFGAGIWQSGAGSPTTSDGDVWYFTGNVSTDGVDAATPHSSSCLQIATDRPGSLDLVSTFQADDAAFISKEDWDLGSSGPLWDRDRRILIGGGKEGVLYAFQRGERFSAPPPSKEHVVQRLNIALRESLCGARPIFGSPVKWGDRVYVWTGRGHLLMIPLRPLKAPGKKGSAPVFDELGIVENVLDDGVGGNRPSDHGPHLAISADGVREGTGIVWAAVWSGSGTTLVANDAEDVTRELYRSSSREDEISQPGRFATPLVAGGRVYVGTHPQDFGRGRIAVFGLLPSPRPPPNDLGPFAACPPSTMPQDATWSHLYDTYFKGCPGCHAVKDTQPWQHFAMGGTTSRDVWDAFTGVPACVRPGSAGRPLVDCCAPATSILGDTFTTPIGAFGTGGSMPPPGGGCDPAEVRAIRDWLAAGAAFDAATPCSCP